MLHLEGAEAEEPGGTVVVSLSCEPWRSVVEKTSGILWSLQVILGPLVLGIALAYGALQWRRRRKLQGEGNYTTREIVMIGLPAVIAVALLTILMMIPGSQ